MTLFKDARDYQIAFLGSFLLLGISTQDWTLRWPLLLLTILTCLITQGLLSWVVKATKIHPSNSLESTPKLVQLWQRLYPNHAWRSALITALSLCLLLRANQPQTMILAGALAIASKFLFRHRSKHFFNPANFGIIAALVFSHDAWVSPGQWGTHWWIALLFIGAGGIVLKRVGRWDTSAVFFLTYAGLEACRNAWLGWDWSVWQHQLSSGSLLLFTLFMLTDPRSIPNRAIARIAWAMSIAVLAFSLEYTLYLSTSIFWALFFLAPTTMLWDSLWSGHRFQWRDRSSLKPNSPRTLRLAEGSATTSLPPATVLTLRPTVAQRSTFS